MKPTIFCPRALLAPAALLFALGCGKSVEPSIYPAAPPTSAELPPAATVDVTGASSGSRRSGAYDFAADLAEGAGPIVSERQLMSSPGAMQVRLEAPPARDAKGKANEASQKQTERQAKKQAQKDDQQPDHGREIIYTAGIQISVYELESAMATVEAIPDTHGGWVHMRSQNQVVLRLPAATLQPVMSTLRELGVVEARTLQAQDVTAEYVDLESRIRVLRETQTQLLELLAKAKTVEEALHVRKALDNVTMELETALGRMRQLSDLIAFSSLTVTLIERGPQDRIPTSNDPFRWVDNLGVEATEWR